jgi:putative ABC transport system permease protein
MPLALRVFGRLRRLVLPPDAARRDEAEVLSTVVRLAADARTRGRLALGRYWAMEFAALLRAAITSRHPEYELPDDAFPDRRRPRMLSALTHDIRYAVRLLRRSPGYTAVAVLTLALGIGANTAIFSLVSGILLKPLPFPQSDRLYRMLHGDTSDPEGLYAMTPGNFYDLQREATLFRPMAAYSGMPQTLTGRGEPQRLTGTSSSDSILEVLGVQPLHGRIYSASDDKPDADRVVVLSYKLWARAFNSDPSIIGQAISLGGQPTTVIGVMPAGFSFPTADSEFWMPARLPPEIRASRTEYYLRGVARLPHGVDRGAAEAELQTIMARLRADYPQANERMTVALTPLRDAMVTNVRRSLWLLLGSVVLVLLIACANLANLLLARATGRTREIAVRQAIGAGRVRIARQLLVESSVLAAAGTAAGLVAGHLFLDALVRWLPAGTPRLDQVAIDGTVLAFTAAVAVASSLFFGLAPALQLARHSPTVALRDAGARTTARSRLRPVLVVSEVALALVLLTGAGLLLRSFHALQRVDPGIPVDNVLTFQVDLSGPKYETPNVKTAFIDEAIVRLGALPGVTAAAAGSGVPLAGRGSGAWFNLIERPSPAGQTPPAVPYRVVTRDYFRTFGIRLVQGRLLDSRDGRTGTPSVVISESVARRFWPDADPIGARIYLGAPDNKLFDEATVVGVVSDVKLAGLDSDITEAVYGLQTLMPFWTGFTFSLRTTGDPISTTRAAREQIRQLDAALPVTNVRTLAEIQNESMAPARSSMLLLTLFAALALVMAAIGVFGVLSFTVTSRTREMGIRMALGAEAGAVRSLVMREGLAQASVGIALGLAGAWWLTRFMSTLLFGIAPRDPWAFGGAALLLLAVSAAACYLPARRATLVDPLAVLRTE